MSLFIAMLLRKKISFKSLSSVVRLGSRGYQKNKNYIKQLESFLIGHLQPTDEFYLSRSERALTKRRTRGFQRIKLTKRIKLENLEQTKYLLRLEIKMFIMTSLISLIQLMS